MSIDIQDRLSIDYSVMQAPMGGGLSNSTLACAVSMSGGLGSLGHAAIDEFRREIKVSKQALGALPFSANLLMPFVTSSHIEACIEGKVPVVSIFCGYRKGLVAALKRAGCIVAYQVGSLEEADRVVADGVDVLIVQGCEAGGHLRGRKPLAELLPVLRDRNPNIGILGAGGVHDSTSASAVISSGADGVVAGTRFLMSTESGAHPLYKEELIRGKRTVVTSLFGFGWHAPHRVLENEATEAWLASDGSAPSWTGVVNKSAELFAKYLPPRLQGHVHSSQNIRFPIFTPVAPTERMSDPRIACSALYAGKCVSEIDALESADAIVKEIGAGCRSRG